MPLLRVPIRCYGLSLGKVKESCLRAWEVGLPVKRRRIQLGTAPLPSVKDHWVPPFFPNLLLLFSFHPPFSFSPLPTDSEAWMLCHRAVVQRAARRGRGQGQGAL